jgi:hypothetical protein
MAMTLTGFVFDSSGNAVSGATVQGYVSADNATTTAESATTTDSNGKWTITTSTASRIPMDVKITFGDSVRWLKAGDSINVSKLTLTDTLTVGEDDEGFDVIFYGETASANMTWDASADDLILNGAARIVVPDGQLVLGSTAVSSTAAELNILDGVTATASELNLLDGGTSVGGSITIADTDGFVVNDGGTMKTIPASDISTYVAASVGDITAVSLTGDSGGALSVSSGTAGFTLTGGTGITTSGSGTTITIAGSDASTSAKGIAQFSSDNFAASSGTITIKDGGIVTAELAADAVTSAKIADDAVTSDHIATNAVVTDSITDANVTLAKIANAAANTVIVRDANSSGVLSAKAVADTQLLIGDGTGFTAATLSGDVSMANDGAVTIANNAVETAMISDNNVTAAKIFDLARGSILYGNSSAATAELTKGSANTVLTSDGTDISWAAAGGGIAKAVIYRLTSSFTGDADPIASNLEKDDTRGDSTLGDDEGLGLSSGVFTFANTGTGTYLIQAHAFFGSGAADAETNLMIEVATDGSTFEQASTSQGSVYNSSARSMLTASYLFQVTNTTNDKVQFKISGNSSSNTIFGDTNINYTYFTFIKLA